jgi:quercetin dioxygenase-like cupin family protein
MANIIPRSAAASEDQVKHQSYGSEPSGELTGEHFTGIVWQDPVIDSPAPARLRALVVRFDPGARTAWHTHPLGQTLFVLSGLGLVQSWGQPIREIRPGDVVWIEPGEKHWHGASRANPMSHLAMQESLDGEHIAWLEPVTEKQYRGG